VDARDRPIAPVGVARVVRNADGTVTHLPATAPPDAKAEYLASWEAYQVMNQAQDRYLSATYPGGLPGFLQTLEDLHPTFVVVSQGLRETWPDQWLADDYRRVGGGAGFVWWLSRSAGPDALAAARFAHDQVMTAFGR